MFIAPLLSTLPSPGQILSKTCELAAPHIGQLAMTVLNYKIMNYFAGQIFTIDPANVEKNGKAFGELFKLIGEGIAQGSEANASSFRRTWIPTLLMTGFATTAVPLIYGYVQKVLLHNIGKPALAIKQHKITYLSQIKDKITETLIEQNLIDAPEPLTKPIFKKEIENKIEDIVRATNNIKRNDAFFQNVILYGPGGTGKTMIAEKIAKEANMNYIMMSGGEFGQFIKRGEHVTELNKLLSAADNSSTPTIIFIDEAESLCRKRNKLDQDHLELQNALLNRTGTPSKNVMIILATNRVTDIDSAILNRMTHKIKIDVPGMEERAEIIDLYAKEFFLDYKERTEFFNPEQIQEFARKTEKLSGRNLFQIINSIFAKKVTTDDNRLTQEIIDRTIDEFVEQETELDAQLEQA